jgi:lipoprotein-anchoring transpeptidase ErfK/SrfK
MMKTPRQIQATSSNAFVKARLTLCLVIALSAAACVSNDSSNTHVADKTGPPTPSAPSPTPSATPSLPSEAAEPYWGAEPEPSGAEIERGRMDQGWKRYVEIDSSERAGRGQAKTSPDHKEIKGKMKERWEDISPERVNQGKMFLPLSGAQAGPSVIRAQTLLDRAGFSPGVIDGHWGKNAEKAVYWLQRREGLTANGDIDAKTFRRMIELAGSPDQLVVERRLNEQDVSGPFVEIPEDIYEQAKLDCMCYESLTEKLSETFHVAPEVLKRLNPNIDLNRLKAGDKINVTNVGQRAEGMTAVIERIVISDGGSYLHALDSTGRVIYHFPSTLGSKYNPSPGGDYKITAIKYDPTWHYQPELLGQSVNKKDAVIPPGPNNAVGKVWIQLSKPHYGIHGTDAPETIGYATSSGCVRLTNWDATFLAGKVKPGTPVEFKDTTRPARSE